MDEVPSASHFKKDARALYGSLLSACQGGVGRRILMEKRGKQDGIRALCHRLGREKYPNVVLVIEM
jgi:hypothetical protein